MIGDIKIKIRFFNQNNLKNLLIFQINNIIPLIIHLNNKQINLN